MRLSLGLELGQRQLQKLAPRMIQSMEILQLPMMALQERIDQEMIENPLLEVQTQDPELPEESYEHENSDQPDSNEKELVVDNEKNNADDFERLMDLDREVPDHFDEMPRRSSNRIQEESDRKHDAMSNVATRPQSLNDHLMDQLTEMSLATDLRNMAERIISSLSAQDGGYLKSNLDDLLPATAGPEQLELAERGLAVVQSMDPPGVAARDLRECLLLQLTADMDHYDELKTLISHHLEDLSDNRLPLIERATGYSIPLIKDAVQEMRKLTPKPAGYFTEVPVPIVTPDVTLSQDADGNYKVALIDTHIPSLYISNYYRQRLRSADCTPEEREFIKRKVNAAQWLIDSIEQRRDTLTKVSQAIVDHQRRFIDDGPDAIEPLKMQQIADKVGVHVTTVSRAVDDKWIQTPRGIFPLKRFFVGGTLNDDGEDVAWDRIRIKLQEVVDHEDKQSPLSDEGLVNALKKHGLNVARRTITKYRQRLNIPSSRRRKEWVEKAAT